MKNNELRAGLTHTIDLLLRHEEHATHVLQSNDPKAVKDLLNEAFPVTGQSFDGMLADFEREILPSMNHNTSTQFGAYITGSGNRVAAVAEFIKLDGHSFSTSGTLSWQGNERLERCAPVYGILF